MLDELDGVVQVPPECAARALVLAHCVLAPKSALNFDMALDRLEDGLRSAWAVGGNGAAFALMALALEWKRAGFPGGNAPLGAAVRDLAGSCLKIYGKAG